jgi:hypothetical protein
VFRWGFVVLEFLSKGESGLDNKTGNSFKQNQDDSYSCPVTNLGSGLCTMYTFS